MNASRIPSMVRARQPLSRRIGRAIEAYVLLPIFAAACIVSVLAAAALAATVVAMVTVFGAVSAVLLRHGGTIALAAAIAFTAAVLLERFP